LPATGEWQSLLSPRRGTPVVHGVAARPGNPDSRPHFGAHAAFMGLLGARFPGAHGMGAGLEKRENEPSPEGATAYPA
jgi:hypothetical protein